MGDSRGYTVINHQFLKLVNPLKQDLECDFLRCKRFNYETDDL